MPVANNERADITSSGSVQLTIGSLNPNTTFGSLAPRCRRSARTVDGTANKKQGVEFEEDTKEKSGKKVAFAEVRGSRISLSTDSLGRDLFPSLQGLMGSVCEVGSVRQSFGSPRQKSSVRHDKLK